LKLELDDYVHWFNHVRIHGTPEGSLYPEDMDFSITDSADLERLNKENWKIIKGYYPKVKNENKNNLM